MRRAGLSLLLASSCALGCNGGPIGDFPRGSHDSKDDSQGAGAPSTGSGSAAGGAVGGSAAGGGASGPNQPGGPGGISSPPVPGTGGLGQPSEGLPGGAGGTVGVGGTGAIGGLLGGTGGPAGGLLSGGSASGGSASGGSTSGALGGLFGGGTGGGGEPIASDAGAGIDASAAPDGGASSDGGDSDGAAPDGSQTGSDGAIPAAGDAGLCSTGSSARLDGGCQGSYCNMTLTTLAESTQPGFCIDEPTLRLACDAQLSRKTAQCAQENALSLSLGSSVRSCLRRDPQLTFTNNSCVDCYVTELTCTLSNCLALCVIGFDVECTSCRRASCGAEFTRCSGLPGL